MDETIFQTEWKCDLCDYTTKRKSDYRRHLGSTRHVERIAPANSRKKLSCICGKTYSHNSGLSRHKTICESYKHSLDDGNLMAQKSRGNKIETSKTKVTNKLLEDLLKQMRD